MDEYVNTFMDLRLNSKHTDDEMALEAWLNNKVNDVPRKLKYRICFENYMGRFKQNRNITGEKLTVKDVSAIFHYFYIYSLFEKWQVFKNR